MSRLILASQSKARKALLKNAGLRVATQPANIDEDFLTRTFLKQKKSPAYIARALAKSKALAVAQTNPGALVIGADQVLHCDGRLFSKAPNKKQALEKLGKLAGRTHHLVSAVCVARDDKILWCAHDTVSLSMKKLSSMQMRAYADKAGPALTRAVGAYELESHGAWLFDHIQGDYFTVLGLPLLPLLTYLSEEHGIEP